MIGWIKGKLLDKGVDWALVDTGGVGYRVVCPASTINSLQADGNDAAFHIYTHVRENEIALFGFSSKLEKEVFLKLISVSDIGPRKALAILSGATVQELAGAIIRGDLTFLTSLQGVGKKTAERLIVEMKDKLVGLNITETGAEPQSPMRQELTAALVSLGYKPSVAEKIVERMKTRLAENSESIETLIKEALAEIKRTGC